MSAEDKYYALGNFYADDLAKQTFAFMPFTEETELKRREEIFWAAQKLCLLAAKTLPLWSKLEKRGRAPSQQVTQVAVVAPAEQAPMDRLVRVWTHNLTSAGEIWRCNNCLTFARSLSKKVARSEESCPGISVTVAQTAAEATALGHSLLVTESQLNIFLFCDRCWAYGCSQPRQLTFACPGREIGEARANARRKIFRGVHPKLGTDLGLPVPFAAVALLHHAVDAA